MSFAELLFGLKTEYWESVEKDECDLPEKLKGELADFFIDYGDNKVIDKIREYNESNNTNIDPQDTLEHLFDLKSNRESLPIELIAELLEYL